jgi:hypothetical protein
MAMAHVPWAPGQQLAVSRITGVIRAGTPILAQLAPDLLDQLGGLPGQRSSHGTLRFLRQSYANRPADRPDRAGEAGAPQHGPVNTQGGDPRRPAAVIYRLHSAQDQVSVGWRIEMARI